MAESFGLLNLYESKDPVVDIVFVHGLNGHPIKTWSVDREDKTPSSTFSQRVTSEHSHESFELDRKTSSGLISNQSICWPRDLLPLTIDDCRILSWGYDAMVVASSHLGIDDHAFNLLVDLTNLRRKESEVHRPVIFVAHSLGGLVVKSAICKSSSDVVVQIRDISLYTVAIVFLGTPHQSGYSSSWVEIVRKIQSAAKLSIGMMSLLGDVTSYSSTLNNTNIAFKNAAQEKINIYSIFETLGSRGLGIIVDRCSAILNVPQERKYALHGNHSTMCKFRSHQDTGYELITNIFHQIISKIISRREARIEPCLKSLQVPKIMEDSRRLYENRRTPGTCEWLVQHSEFVTWRHGASSKVLWVTGNPGCGKSTLVSYLCRNIENDVNSQVQPPADKLLYYFCNSAAKDTPVIIVRSFLCQLLVQTPSLRQALETFSLSMPGFWRSFKALWQVFTQLLSGFTDGTLYCVCDALDEINGDNALSFVRGISSNLLALPRPTIKVVVSARQHTKLIAILCSLPKKAVLDLDNQRYVKEDISRMLTESIDKLSTLSHEQMVSVTQELTDTSGGSFLETRLHFERLRRRSITATEIQSIVKQAAHGGIASAFDAVVTSITTKGLQMLAKQALVWLVTAQRPLTFDELDVILKEQPNVNASFTSKSFLKLTLGSVLETTDELVIVRRQSFENYLKENTAKSQHQAISPFQYDLSKRNKMLAKECVSHLIHMVTCQSSTSGAYQSSTGLFQYMGHHKLAQYSISHWMDHIRGVETWELSEWEVTETLFQTKQILVTWWNSYITLEPLQETDLSQVEMEPLQVAVSFRLDTVVRRLLATSQRTKQTQSFTRSLQIASSLGYAEICQLLLDAGADPVMQINGRNCLHIAAKKQNEDALGVILDRQIRVEDTDQSGRTALHLACESGSVSIIEMILKKGADINKMSTSGLSAIHYAVQAGSEGAIRHLLTRGANVNILNVQGESPLHTAVKHGYTDQVQLLLSKGSDSNLKMEGNMTALHLAARKGSEIMVSALLIAGANPQSRSDNGSTPLHEAALAGSLDCARALILAKASLEVMDISGRAPLHLAAEYGHTEMVSLILDSLGSDKAAKDRDLSSRTALHYAAQPSGSISAIQLLVQSYRYDPNAQDSLGLTPLHEAVRYLKPAVELLLNFDADPMIEDQEHKSSIAFAISMGSHDILKILLEACDLENNLHGSVYLQEALSQGHESIVRLLVTDFLSWIAQEDFEYLLDLQDSGYTNEDLIGFLLDVQINSPWIPEESWAKRLSGFVPEIKRHFHQTQCAHTSASDSISRISSVSANQLKNSGWARTFTDVISKAARIDMMRNTICGICGIGGMLPPSDMMDGGNEIEFSHGGATVIFDIMITATESKLFEIFGAEKVETVGRSSMSDKTEVDKSQRGSARAVVDEVFQPLLLIATANEVASFREHKAPFRLTHRLLQQDPKFSSSSASISTTMMPDSITNPKGVITQASQKRLVLFLKNIVSNIQEAVNVLQSEGFCCDSITVLVYSGTESISKDDPKELPVIALNSIDLNVVAEFAESVNQASSDLEPEGIFWPRLVELSKEILIAMQGHTRGTAFWKLFSFDSMLDQAHICTLAVQALCTALVSFSHAHAGRCYPCFLEKPIDFVLLQGLSVDRPAIVLEPRHLMCMQQVVQNDVLVFHFYESGWAAQSREKSPQGNLLLASGESIADTWGATMFISDPQSQFGEKLVGLDINGGTIKKQQHITTSDGRALYHWHPYPSTYNEEDTFDAWDRILIGIVTTNASCPLNEGLSRKSSNNCFVELGTLDSGWVTNQRQAALQAGNYLVAQAGVTQTKIPGIPVKNTIFGNWAKDFDLELLGAPWGLQVSLCTGLARRVQLKDLLSEPVFTFLDCHPALFKDWTTVRDKAKKGLIEMHCLEDFYGWVQSLSETEQQCITKVIDYVLDKLRDTGVDREGKYLSVWWPEPHNARGGVRINAIEGRSWFQMLQESPTCAVFAAITTQCFENKDHKCRNRENANWLGGGSSLETAVHLDDSHNSGLTQAQQLQLKHGQTYWINRHGKCWVKVDRERQSSPAKLKVNTHSLPSALHKKIVKDGILRERRVYEAPAENVEVPWPERGRLRKNPR